MKEKEREFETTEEEQELKTEVHTGQEQLNKTNKLTLEPEDQIVDQEQVVLIQVLESYIHDSKGMKFRDYYKKSTTKKLGTVKGFDFTKFGELKELNFSKVKFTDCQFPVIDSCNFAMSQFKKCQFLGNLMFNNFVNVIFINCDKTKISMIGNTLQYASPFFSDGTGKFNAITQNGNIIHVPSKLVATNELDVELLGSKIKKRYENAKQRAGDLIKVAKESGNNITAEQEQEALYFESTDRKVANDFLIELSARIDADSELKEITASIKSKTINENDLNNQLLGYTKTKRFAPSIALTAVGAGLSGLAYYNGDKISNIVTPKVQEFLAKIVANPVGQRFISKAFLLPLLILGSIAGLLLAKPKALLELEEKAKQTNQELVALRQSEQTCLTKVDELKKSNGMTNGFREVIGEQSRLLEKSQVLNEAFRTIN